MPSNSKRVSITKSQLQTMKVLVKLLGRNVGHKYLWKIVGKATVAHTWGPEDTQYYPLTDIDCSLDNLFEALMRGLELTATEGE